MTDRKRFASWVRWLRRRFPSDIPVRVRLSPPERMPAKHFGFCVFDDETGRAVLDVADNQNEIQTRESLFEEWAHVLRFHLHRIGEPPWHDALYGVLFTLLKDAWDKEG